MKGGVILLRFCPKCETRMKTKFEEGIELCPKCGFSSDKGKEKNVSENPTPS